MTTFSPFLSMWPFYTPQCLPSNKWLHTVATLTARTTYRTIFNITYRDCDKGTGSAIICVRRDDIRESLRLWDRIGGGGTWLTYPASAKKGATGGFLWPVSKSFNHVRAEFITAAAMFWFYMSEAFFQGSDYFLSLSIKEKKYNFS